MVEGERINVPNRCVMGARSGREQGGEQGGKFFVDSGGVDSSIRMKIIKPGDRVHRDQIGTVVH